MDPPVILAPPSPAPASTSTSPTGRASLRGSQSSDPGADRRSCAIWRGDVVLFVSADVFEMATWFNHRRSRARLIEDFAIYGVNGSLSAFDLFHAFRCYSLYAIGIAHQSLAHAHDLGGVLEGFAFDNFPQIWGKFFSGRRAPLVLPLPRLRREDRLSFGGDCSPLRLGQLTALMLAPSVPQTGRCC